MESSTSHLVLAADAAIDLQTHAIYSDGKWTPEQLIDYLLRLTQASQQADQMSRNSVVIFGTSWHPGQVEQQQMKM